MPFRAPWLRPAVFGGALLLTGGCGAPFGAGCTAVGAVDGVSTTVTDDSVRGLEALELEVCREGRCTKAEVALSAGTVSVDQGCDDGICVASASPDGTLVGFAPLDLPGGEVEIRATVTNREGQTRVLVPVRARAEVVRPNGPQCPGEAHQLALTIDSEGLSTR
ncbi:hypothetical protein E2F48_03155 [Arthrobacter crusticola]|uniref:Uncharacterized protein n=1 Tax=Arthrobacter crusticola TaxID=2547960 RepID=A0A4R5U350_9MICC|nr:hypothetical protein [Arthrobacter crusticola]TDK28109.1 hypothetical protein E2F48_03155 [Arthrobacter crusticola]